MPAAAVPQARSISAVAVMSPSVPGLLGYGHRDRGCVAENVAFLRGKSDGLRESEPRRPVTEVDRAPVADYLHDFGCIAWLLAQLDVYPAMLDRQTEQVV